MLASALPSAAVAGWSAPSVGQEGAEAVAADDDEDETSTEPSSGLRCLPSSNKKEESL